MFLSIVQVSIRDTSDPDWPKALKLLDVMQTEFSALSDEMKDLVSEAKLFSYTNLQQKQPEPTEQQQSVSWRQRQRGKRKKDKSKNDKKRALTSDDVHVSSSSSSDSEPLSQQQRDLQLGQTMLNDQSLALLKELQDCFELLSLRAKHVSICVSKHKYICTYTMIFLFHL